MYVCTYVHTHVCAENREKAVARFEQSRGCESHGEGGILGPDLVLHTYMCMYDEVML